MKKYKIKIQGSEYEVNIHSVENNLAHLTVNNVEFDVEIEGLMTNPTRMSTKSVMKTSVPTMQSSSPVVKPVAAPSSGSAHPVKSPLPGVILDIKVNPGDKVKNGQLVMILEAMKMENNIEADKDGVIETIKPSKGDSVLEGDVLFTIK
jgi:Acetyl/propionyl-CoA carboxylase, alpha subunit